MLLYYSYFGNYFCKLYSTPAKCVRSVSGNVHIARVQQNLGRHIFRGNIFYLIFVIVILILIVIAPAITAKSCVSSYATLEDPSFRLAALGEVFSCLFLAFFSADRCVQGAAQGMAASVAQIFGQVFDILVWVLVECPETHMEILFISQISLTEQSQGPCPASLSNFRHT